VRGFTKGNPRFFFPFFSDDLPSMKKKSETFFSFLSGVLVALGWLILLGDMSHQFHFEPNLSLGSDTLTLQSFSVFIFGKMVS
jgi:hypothetical protein